MTVNTAAKTKTFEPALRGAVFLLMSESTTPPTLVYPAWRQARWRRRIHLKVAGIPTAIIYSTNTNLQITRCIPRGKYTGIGGTRILL